MALSSEDKKASLTKTVILPEFVESKFVLGI
jgi:hypothetical protein